MSKDTMSHQSTLWSLLRAYSLGNKPGIDLHLRALQRHRETGTNLPKCVYEHSDGSFQVPQHETLNP